LENDFPLEFPLLEDPLPLLDPVPLELPSLEPPFALVVLETGIWRDFAVEYPFESKAEMTNVKVPASLGVPESVPESLVSPTPFGNCPETTAKVYGAVPPVTLNEAL
jgi:hypothetical protein